MSRGTVCAVHVHDTTVPLEDHHIWPRGYHGPDTPANRTRICCNAHADAHYYLEALLKRGGHSPDDWRTYGPLVRTVAGRGYVQVMAYAAALAATYEATS